MVSLRNGRGIWNVRAMPRWQTRYGGRPAISSPWNCTEPPVGASVPAIRLKVVLLPEPFGPIRPRISPCSTSNDTRLTAVKPPNLFVSSRTLSMRESAGADTAPLPLARCQRGEYGLPAGSGITGSIVLIAAGQAIFVSPPMYCITTGLERSFWPAISVPGGKNLTP